MPDSNEEDEIKPNDLGRKLIVALRSVTDPQALMQSISDRSIVALRGELATQIAAINRGVDLAHDDLVRVPTDVQKAITALREVIEARLEGLAEIDKASTLQRGMLLEQIDKSNQHLKTLHDEKFAAIKDTIEVLKDTMNDRFTQNDQNTEKAFNAAKTAVSERDASNKESANKSEANLTKLIGALDDNVKTLSASTSAQIVANKTTLDDKIGDLKDRVVAIEGRKGGSDDIWKVVGILIAILISIAAIIVPLARPH